MADTVQALRGDIIYMAARIEELKAQRHDLLVEVGIVCNRRDEAIGLLHTAMDDLVALLRLVPKPTTSYYAAEDVSRARSTADKIRSFLEKS